MSDCCARCDNPMVSAKQGMRRAASHFGRGLCGPCHDTVDHEGRLADFPRRTWSRDELMSEWELLRSEGHTRVQAAARLNMSVAAFDRAVWRARAAGDPRAEPGVAGGVRAATKAAVERARNAVRDAADLPAAEAVPTPSRELVAA